MTRLAIVLGTYNRLAHLKEAVLSISRAVASGERFATIGYATIVVDGGSTDGSREWLAGQDDVELICQDGPLPGAVVAFNAGFAYAVEHGFDYVANFNDDAIYQTPGMLSEAVCRLEASTEPVGAIAFQFDLPGRPDGFEYINGLPYGNFGVTRREAGVAVARAQGDPTGRAWWNPIYHTYGADSEFGAWLWRLGWTIHTAPGLCVHDGNVQDDLRKGNEQSPRRLADGRLFWARWPSKEHILTLGPTAA